MDKGRTEPRFSIPGIGISVLVNFPSAPVTVMSNGPPTSVILFISLSGMLFLNVNTYLGLFAFKNITFRKSR